MYKYKTLCDEIIKFLKQQKKNGLKTYILRATDVNKIFDSTQICGESRYPMICQTMEYATKYIKGYR